MMKLLTLTVESRSEDYYYKLFTEEQAGDTCRFAQKLYLSWGSDNLNDCMARICMSGEIAGFRAYLY